MTMASYPTRFSTLIVDDERIARQRLRRMLASEPDFDILGECATGNEAREFLERMPVDVMFLDIQMPELDGFGVVESRADATMPMIVFVTAHDEHAVRAFEVNAVDYLLKPYDEERLQKCIQRVRAQAPLLNAPRPATAAKARPSRLAIKSGGRVVFVKTEDIDWVEAADNYVCIHVGSETHVLRETMTALQSRLSPDRFSRVHRSFIVNVERIKELQPWFHGEYMVVLHDGKQLTLSRSYRENLMSLLGS